jgi:DNA polymerase I
MSEEEATDIRQKFFDCYQMLAVWHFNAIGYAKEYPEFGQTLMGRKRRLHPRAEDCRDWWSAFQFLTNHVVQGSCADSMKLALVWTHEKLNPDRARLVSTIHDEIVIVAQDDYVEEASKIVKEQMEGAAYEVFGASINFIAEVKVGQNWACK